MAYRTRSADAVLGLEFIVGEVGHTTRSGNRAGRELRSGNLSHHEHSECFFIDTLSERHPLSRDGIASLAIERSARHTTLRESARSQRETLCGSVRVCLCQGSKKYSLYGHAHIFLFFFEKTRIWKFFF